MVIFQKLNDCFTVNYDTIVQNSYEFGNHKNVYAVNWDLFIPAHIRTKINVLG